MLIKTRKAIARYVGEYEEEIPTLVKDKGLPAWRTRPNGIWKALQTDLDAWLMQRARECLGEVDK